MKQCKVILHRALLWLVLAVLAVAAGPLVPAVGAAPATDDDVQRWQSQQIGELTEDLEDSEKNLEHILFPVTVLLGILALGGGLGVVFSIRDQRRVSQLHELTVTGEVSSQRRSEQSYASFLEQSQTTLSLVNDTLELAKEATDRAAKSVEGKAKLRVDAIEERAQRLMLDVFTSREFELVVEDQTRRDELEAIGDELRALEGYLSLQDIELKDYAKFVRALEQFLSDETEAALQALQLAAQGKVVGELQKFIEYWLGYMLTTVGQYEEAITRFEHDEIDLPKGSSQYFQLERIKAETRFFALAKPVPGTASWNEDTRTDPRGPHQRFEAVALVLEELRKLAKKVAESESHQAKIHTQLEIARTQADVFEWVAYDENHLDEPLSEDAIERGRKIMDEYPTPRKPTELTESPLWKMLVKPDLLRYWALRQAREICETKFGEPNVEVDFALAESLFKLRDPGAIGAFEKAEQDLPDNFGEHREKRREVALQQSLLICHCRLFTLREEAEEKGEKLRADLRAEGKDDSEVEIPRRNEQEEKRHIRSAQRHTNDKLSEMRQRRVTIFSHIQRRNLTQEEFRAEVKEIVDQEKGMDEGGEQEGVKEAGK
jgi:tetratricopeptide (TPR) repeat protein